MYAEKKRDGKGRWQKWVTIQMSYDGLAQGSGDQDKNKLRGRKNILEVKPGDLANGLYMGLAERNKEQFLNFWLKQLTIRRCHFLSQRETGN